MGPIGVAQVVVVAFPFSNLAGSKLRPAVVLANAGRGDWLLCQVTSNPFADADAVVIDATDFREGGLPMRSFVRPAKLFTAESSIIRAIAARLLPASHARIVEAVVNQIRSGGARDRPSP